MDLGNFQNMISFVFIEVVWEHGMFEIAVVLFKCSYK